MNPAIWPVRRDDGSRTVAVRFRYSDTDAPDQVRQAVATWIEDHPESDLNEDLSRSPSINVLDQESLDLLIEARPDSRHWKDWMVYLTQAIRASVSSVECEGFADLVGGMFRPYVPD